MFDRTNLRLAYVSYVTYVSMLKNVAGKSRMQNVLLFFSQDAFDEAVKFFGENSKTTPPSVFFPVFVRFVKAYRVRLMSPPTCS